MSEKPLRNRKYEVIAQQLARGAAAIEASLAAGYRSDGSAFAANCRQRANCPQVKARVAALQAKALEKVNLDLGWIFERLGKLPGAVPIASGSERAIVCGRSICCFASAAITRRQSQL
jgi:hypothetical protein